MNPKSIAIRADASAAIGTGHIMRCLVLAKQLRSIGADVVFICRDLPGHMADYIVNQGYVVELLRGEAVPDGGATPDWLADALQSLEALQRRQAPVEWLVVDHYQLDKAWELQLAGAAKRILVIDDLANREHSCHLLLDPNLRRSPHVQRRLYEALVPADCRLFLGSAYLLLREEFLLAGRRAMRVRDRVRRLLVFFGGSDPTRETEKTLAALQACISEGLIVDVVVGQANSEKHRIGYLCAKSACCRFHIQTNRMAELMTEADLAIGAGGGALLERAYLGLPAIVIIVADNQRESVLAAADKGAVVNLGCHDQVTAEQIRGTVMQLMHDQGRLSEMSRNAGTLIQEHASGLHPVVQAMTEGLDS